MSGKVLLCPSCGVDHSVDPFKAKKIHAELLAKRKAMFSPAADSLRGTPSPFPGIRREEVGKGASAPTPVPLPLAKEEQPKPWELLPLRLPQLPRIEEQPAAKPKDIPPKEEVLECEVIPASEPPPRSHVRPSDRPDASVLGRILMNPRRVYLEVSWHQNRAKPCQLWLVKQGGLEPDVKIPLGFFTSAAEAYSSFREIPIKVPTVQEVIDRSKVK